MPGICAYDFRVKSKKSSGGNRSFISIMSVILIAPLLSALLSGLLMTLSIGTITARLTWLYVIYAFFSGCGVLAAAAGVYALRSKTSRFLLLVFSVLVVSSFNFTGLLLIAFMRPVLFISILEHFLMYAGVNLLFALSFSLLVVNSLFYQMQISRQQKLLSIEENSRKEAEYRALLAQVQPHFLFNTLNLLAGMSTPGTAIETAILDLSAFLRFVLDASKNRRITLDEEIKGISHYLAIQKRRFADRLTYYIENSTSANIPPLLLLPLIENSIKHNMQSVKHLEIRVSCRSEGSETILDVSDSQKNVSMEDAGRGTGLSNLMKRVEHTGGAINIAGGRIEIRLPAGKTRQ